MIAHEYINYLLPSVKKGDHAERVIDWMDEFGVKQLPVVENEAYCGLITESSLLEFDFSSGFNYPACNLEYKDVYTNEHAHLFELLNIAGKHDIEVLPILDEQQHYKGCIVLKDLLHSLAHMFASQVAGGILVLQVDAIQYSLAEISRIVESNNARILSSFVEHDPNDPKVIQVTLKLNTEELSHIQATFERYSYHILYRYSPAVQKDNNTERLQMLLRYLDI